MSVNFEFNAPQYFHTSEDPDADKFFDYVTDENDVKKYLQPLCNIKPVECKAVETENKDPSGIQPVATYKYERSPVLRNIFSDRGNQQTQHCENKNEKQKVDGGGGEEEEEEDLVKDLQKLHVSRDGSCKKTRITRKEFNVFEGIKIEKQNQKPHSMTTRLDSQINTPILHLRNRRIPRKTLGAASETSSDAETFNSCVSNNGVGLKRKGSPLSGKKKFVSLAERVQHFHFDTPDRFRTIPKKSIVPDNIKLRGTIPKTPVLTAKFRHRPVNFPNEKEREEMELQEMMKHQVKANPINEKILKGPVLNLKCAIEKKPTTVPEPFKLTQTKKKEHLESPVFVFKAHPLPTAILNGPVGVPLKKVPKTTVPWTPNIKQPLRFINSQEIQGKGSNAESTEAKILPRTTKVQPFSFDPKIKELLRKKEENIKKVLEQEKKAFNSFKAHPLPNFLTHGTGDNSVLSRYEVQKSTSSTPVKCKKEPDNVNFGSAFKAKRATVIHQKPFAPVLPKHEPVLPENICLNTEKRALERQKFDEKIKQKEELQAQILKERQEEEEKLERKKKLEERKLTEFKAHPVPKYKPFELQPSDPSCLTLAKSPKCLSRK